MPRVVIVTIAALVLASPAAAQNILVNPGLDTADQLDGWTCNVIQGDASWNSQDRSQSPTSGSMQQDVTSNANNRDVSCEQCVPVLSGLDYIASGWFFWPDDPDVWQLGTARALFWFYSNADCSGTFEAGSAETVTPTLDTWTFMSTDVVTAPAMAQSAIVLYVTWQDFADQPVRGRFDDLDFRRAFLLFSDDFETGDLSRWSEVSP